LLAATLPGFDLFRYPGKLSTFAVAAVAALAGAGWDRLTAGHSRVPQHASRAALIATLVTLGLVSATRGPILAWLHARLPPDIEFGPVDPQRALQTTVDSLVHGGLVFALGIGLTTVAPRHPRWAGTVALLAMVLDLAVAGSRLVWTLPQAEFDKPSTTAQELAAA
jgi:hypothetical protein